MQVQSQVITKPRRVWAQRLRGSRLVHTLRTFPDDHLVILAFGAIVFHQLLPQASDLDADGGIQARVVFGRLAKGIDADGFATAVSVLGSARGLEFVEQRAGAAVMIVDSGGSVSQSSWFPAPLGP